MKNIPNNIIKEIIDSYNVGKSISFIGRQFSISRSVIERILKQNNIVIENFKYKIIRENIHNMIDLYQSGKHTTEIASIYNLSASFIWSSLKKAGVKLRSLCEINRIYDINEKFFDNIDNEEKAYFLGFLYADGCNGKENRSIKISLKDEYSENNLLQKFSKMIYKNHPENHVINYTRINQNNYKEVSLTFHSKYMRDQLTKLGCSPVKSLTAIFPQWLDSKLFNHFIRGYYDGDGGTNCIDKGGTFSICGTNDFLINIKNILETECKVNVSIGKYTAIHRLYVSGNRQIARVLNWLYNDSNIFLERKYNRYLDILNKNNSTDEKYGKYVFINDEVIKNIINLYDNKKTITEISKILNISRFRISGVLKKALENG